MVSLTSCVVGGGDASVSRMVPPSIVRGGGGARWATWPWVLSLGCLLKNLVGGGWALDYAVLMPFAMLGSQPAQAERR